MALVIAAQLSDLTSFISASFLLPIAAEQNPIVRTLYVHGGIAAVVAYKLTLIALMLVAIAILPRRLKRPVTVAYVLLGAAGFVANTAALLTR